MSDNDTEFCDMVLYFWQEKGDPTRYSSWEATRCMKLMPRFYSAWQRYVDATQYLDYCANEAKESLPEPPQ